MQLKSYHGLLILLLGFLFLRWRKPTIAKNVPSNLSQPLQQILSGTKYSNYAPFWLAVAKMETAGFTSNLYRKANNPWGMKVPKQRQNTTAGVYNTGPFAKYIDLDDAAKDIELYMNARQFKTGITNLDDFVGEMKRQGYFGDESKESYLQKVKAWLDR